MNGRHLHLLWVMTFGLAIAPPGEAQEVCAACHLEVAQAFAGSGHGRHFTADASYSAATCTSCHIGGEEHVASGAETKPVNPSVGEADAANAGCMTCHESNPAQAHWEGSPHQAAGVRCASCHDVHVTHSESERAVGALPGLGATTENCLQCHAGMRSNLMARSSHPLRDGAMECTSCHGPHGTIGEKLLLEASVNDGCYTCHQNVRGPFLWEHSPVREDCMTCHKAHGSNYPSLLQARVTQLCQSCHQQGRHQTVAGVPAAVWVGDKACVNCHSQIHGSNHPSGPLFMR
jgi:DmsE family decaheme c-type cytochrome